MLADTAHEQLDERMRIVPQALWDRVKARQKQRTRDVGALVKGGLRKNAPVPDGQRNICFLGCSSAASAMRVS
jgi:hypothetical protein